MTEKKETKKDNKKILNLDSVLVRPHVTEKATTSSENNVYVFEVSKDANKFQIKEAVEFLYKVTPIKIRVVTIPSKNIIYRGKKGVKSGGKKAYITLKEGDKISIV
jgi:large subunit ribosomal protein L23